IQVRRGSEHLRLQMVITLPAWRTIRGLRIATAPINYLARFVLMALAIFIAFGRPDQLSSRLAALSFASASVAEGYPSGGWLAALHDLPPVLVIPICLATASWLLGSLLWLAFFGTFPRPLFTRSWPWALASLSHPTLVL